MSVTTASADWRDTFKEGVNNFDTNGTINLNSATIINAPSNGKLPTDNYYQGGDSNFGSCISSNGTSRVCRDGGSLAELPSGRIDFAQCQSSSTVDLGPPSYGNETVNIAEGEYRNVSVANGSDKKIVFTTSNGKYKIKNLSATSGKIEFSSGQYWIETMSINNGVQLIFPTTGRVTFFIKNDYIQKNLTLASSPENLLFYHYGKFEIEGGASLNAYVVSESTVTINGSAKIKGAVTGKDIVLGGSSSVTFVDSADLIDVVPDCTIEVETPLTCFTDDFQRTDLGDDWVVSKSRGSFTPSIVSNRLRVTQTSTNQATSSTYQRLFPAEDNFVSIEFDHFAYDGNGADGIALVLSDGSITPQAGAYGGPLGYGARSNENGFAGGWLGFGIDEYGNFSREGGPSGPGRRRQSVAIRGSGTGTAGYPYLRGTCSNGTTNTNGSCLSPTVDNNNVSPAHRYRITIDSQITNQSIVKVERNTGSGFVEIISAFDAAAIITQAAIPDNFLLSLTGSTGGSTNKHEIDNVEICALKSNPVGIQIDHFEYSYSGQGITCAPKILSIKACANTDCTQTVTETVTATLSPVTITGGGWVGGNVVTFTGGEKSDLQLRRNTPGIVTLGVTGSTPSTKAFSETLCRINGEAASVASCNLVFADSGFIFDVPDKLANKPTGNISISAVKKSDETLQCVPTFADTTKDVSFWSSYIDPSLPINGQSVTVNSKVMSKLESAATTLALAFDNDGKAELIVNYPDAGKIQLDAKYTGTGDEEGLVMTGSDEFVSFPVGLCVTPEDSSAKCAAGNSTCDVYKKAGESFKLVIQGKAWEFDGDTNFCDNINTPNYAHENITLAHELVAPSDGVLGAVGTTQYNHVAQTTNTNTVPQSVTEVGVFQFTAKPLSNYLGSSFYDIPMAESPSIGRFVPDRFVVSNISVVPSCGSFNYMDQPFKLALTLNTVNTGTYVTQNYQGVFAKANAILVGENANNGVDLSARLSDLPIDASSWALGEASVDITNLASFNRMTAPGVDGPFSLLDIGVQVFDNDGDFALVASADMLPGSSSICADNNTCTAKLLSTQDFRHGRVVMDNTYGPENEILRMTTYAQYWNGSDWITNIDDSCTQVIDPLDGTEVYAPSLTAGQSVTRSDAGSEVNSGKLTLLWESSGLVPYRGQVTAPLTVDDWLKWYWNWDDASSTLLYNPKASAYFGRYRGHDRIIYWREVNQ
ncbi:DUF6701 domain-containing protein [Shewanella polaris]|nr:DUF6701 domain-containing protein [Shewanella polaris]